MDNSLQAALVSRNWRTNYAYLTQIYIDLLQRLPNIDSLWANSPMSKVNFGTGRKGRYIYVHTLGPMHFYRCHTDYLGAGWFTYECTADTIHQSPGIHTAVRRGLPARFKLLQWSLYFTTITTVVPVFYDHNQTTFSQ